VAFIRGDAEVFVAVELFAHGGIERPAGDWRDLLDPSLAERGLTLLERY
jgi:hypothetical protein